MVHNAAPFVEKEVLAVFSREQLPEGTALY